MYVIKGLGATRLLRMVVPMVTFPIGCGAEAYSAWLVFQQVRPFHLACPHIPWLACPRNAALPLTEKPCHTFVIHVMHLPTDFRTARSLCLRWLSVS